MSISIPASQSRCPRALRLLIILMTVLLTVTAARAQKEHNVWYCSSGIVIDFNGSTPTVNPFGSPATTSEGTSSVCDGSTGRTLFFTDGLTVWNRDTAVMPNGTGLLGDPSSTQSALIVPAPADPGRYYIFTTGSFEGSDNGLNYSIVDMSRNGGLGAVTTKNMPLLSSASEKLTAIRHCNGRDFWVIAHARNGNEFHAFLVTPSGVTARPVTTGIGEESSNWIIGCLKASPDGRKLAAANWFESACWLLDFDPATGIISRPIRFETGTPAYGVGFSPDNSKLYFIGVGEIPPSTRLFQYQMVPDDSASIIASKLALPGSDDLNIGTLQLGPDGKLYIAISGSSSIAAIAFPNVRGTGCGFTPNAFDVSPQMCGFGLSNNIDCMISACVQAHAAFDVDATTICRGSSVRVTDRSTGQVKSWSFPGGSPSTSTALDPGPVTYNTPGSYTIRLVVIDGWGNVDSTERTVTVTAPPTVDAGPDLTTCRSRCVELTPSVTGGVPPYIYLWSPTPSLACTSCPSPRACPTATTTYYLTVIDANGCQGSDSVTVRIVEPWTGSVSIPRNLTAAPGEVVDVPIMLDDSVDLSGIDRLDLTLRYDASMMRLQREVLLGSRVAGTLLDGWTSVTLTDTSGFFAVRLFPPAGLSTRPAKGALMHLRFATYLSAHRDSMPALSSELPLEIESEADCLTLLPKSGQLRLALCGLSYRVIEMTGAKYAIKGITPNPVGHIAEIGFSLGLDGPTRVEIFDASGRHAATLLDERLGPGEYSLRWDATDAPSGLYYCRISSGDWTATQSVMLVK